MIKKDISKMDREELLNTLTVIQQRCPFVKHQFSPQGDKSRAEIGSTLQAVVNTPGPRPGRCR